MILLVEDDAPSGRAIALALKTAGHEVMNAGDGTEALELLSIHHFELVITDLLMPKLNGQNLFNTIRLKWPHMPIILMSGYLSQDLGKAIVDGISAFLQKPFTPTALLMTVERLLPQSQQLMRMAKYLARSRPRCNGYVGIVLREPGRDTPLRAGNGQCLRCGYRLAWIVIRGKRDSARHALLPRCKASR